MTDSNDSGSSEGSAEATAFDESAALERVESVELTPAEHQRVKDLVNGEQMQAVANHDRVYLIAGAGGETGAATRRKIVYDLLEHRSDPPAISIRLEDFGLTKDHMPLWCRVFDILCGRATYIVAVIEDFDGGYVWELGLLFAPSYREDVYILKRKYADAEVERAKYDNGMAISHIELLLDSDRIHEWIDTDELKAVVAEIP
ncbi:hypothetical protein [Haloarcula nitratireducens]|uniref:Uncharacterized protein n=1 Tax=Haloarcula nitratireducens TaxID=2487749 RepID=A0AAW4PIQ7_9EURY|nr:hypothetical protein [Halomicroarcula nitratireducens]MBX0297102.1 hypothetical protein [Halomicroarcula nitratireducens]